MKKSSDLALKMQRSRARFARDLDRRNRPGKSLAKKPELQGDLSTSPIGAFHVLIATYIRSTL